MKPFSGCKCSWTDSLLLSRVSAKFRFQWFFFSPFQLSQDIHKTDFNLIVKAQVKEIEHFPTPKVT